MNEIRLLIDDLFDAFHEGSLEQMLVALEDIDAWRERDRRRILRRRRRAGGWFALRGSRPSTVGPDRPPERPGGRP